MSTYTPNRWAVIELSKENMIEYSVLAGWSGGYLDGDSWRLSSVIKSYNVDDDLIEFYNTSGSVYQCHVDSEGFNTPMTFALQSIKNANPLYNLNPIAFKEYVKRKQRTEEGD